MSSQYQLPIKHDVAKAEYNEIHKKNSLEETNIRNYNNNEEEITTRNITLEEYLCHDILKMQA